MFADIAANKCCSQGKGFDEEEDPQQDRPALVTLWQHHAEQDGREEQQQGLAKQKTKAEDNSEQRCHQHPQPKHENEGDDGP